MAEVIINYVGRGKFKGFSAGSQPATAPSPFAMATLQRLHFPTDGLRSKNWEEFVQPDAPLLDFVITVCDNAAGEVCPVWPGQPITAHWSVPDPAAAQGTDEQKWKIFADVSRVLLTRIRMLASLQVDKLDRLSLQNELREIGRTGA